MEKEDKELNAIGVIIKALSELDTTQQKNALDYVTKRFGINLNLENTQKSVRREGSVEENLEGNPINTKEGIIKDIRTLKEEKSPKTAIQMAVLVAYYLSRVATSEEKIDTIGVAEIDKYFDQAKYPLPKSSSALLVDTKRAGYFESVERGRYKLNPVGYNLAAHSMGSGNTEATKRKSFKKK